MKIALLTDGIYPLHIGGMQKHSWCLARYLAKSGAEITVFYPFTGSEPAEQKIFTEQDITEIRVPWPKHDKLPGHYIRANKKFATQVADWPAQWENFDLIYSQGFTGFGLFCANKTKVQKFPPIIVNLHGLEIYRKFCGVQDAVKKLLLRPIASFVLRSANAVVSLGGDLNQILMARGIKENKILQIPNGIESKWLEGEYKASNKIRAFTFIGRYERRKGIHLLHSAIQNLDQSEKDRAHFTIIGPVPADHRIKAHNVTYTGQINDEKTIRQILSRSDILVLPSFAEGMPTVILEAMACGNAVICTDTGATTELVDEENGWVIPVNDEAALTKTILQATNLDPLSLDGKKQISLHKVRQYEWTRVAEITLKTLEDFANKTKHTN